MTLDKVPADIRPAVEGHRGDILMLCHRIPYPPDKGDKIRSYNMLLHLVRSGWRVHLGALVDDPADMEHCETLKALCASVMLVPVSSFGSKLISFFGVLRGNSMSVEYFRSAQLQRWVDEKAASLRLRAVLCVCAPMAEYVFRSPALSSSSRPSARAESRHLKLLMDFMDVDSEKWRDYAASAGFPMRHVYGLEAALLRRYEQKIAARFHHVLFVSEDEAGVFRERVCAAEGVSGLSNGVDMDTFAAMPPVRNHRMFFCGAMSYLPNVDAVEWFARSVFPLVREVLPDAEFFVVGSNPASRVQHLAAIDGVTVTGKVPDVRLYARDAALCVVPLRIARGLQNKVLEAMAMARPVVATPEAVTGIAGRANHDFVVERADAEAFSSAVLALLREPERAEAVGRNGRRVVEEKYRWSSCLKGLDDLLQ
ncbi:TIGR03087 family PEP-CTERM/XrtA system glycosyltransferase [Desulfovibrio mangrovi]|uniref:TIGR03087 family PEP-CTERM/XrtA system glycosyltransferase n=1 Tax=Desulfovibrio mangrovi TaxID=2976983 RepID=UPI00224841B1|nr:TIGR03087 family PEP-CTERM/XrtA system glycosyltransferase [Desulfovibrio mangrovi]UZP67553.1 TIGR03087 family PEP-CTERM/XrtA system glycosyltransferase [Desulfovibrio mangrovi]